MNRGAEFARIAERLLSMPSVIDALQAIDSAVTAPGAAQLALASDHAWLQPIADAFAGDPPRLPQMVTARSRRAEAVTNG